MKLSANHPFRSAMAKARFMALSEERAKEWPVASETRMVDTSFGQTFVRISGPEDAPPLVLLHGANVSSLSWIPNAAALSEHFRIYAVDTIYDFGTARPKRLHSQT